MKGPALNLSAIAARRILAEAMEHVHTHAGRTPGRDGRSFEKTFGKNRKSQEYRATFEMLYRSRRKYRFTTPRITRVGAKRRDIAVQTFGDRIMMTCIAMAARKQCPPRRANVARKGLDSRWAVAALALQVGKHEDDEGAKTDFQSAYPSLRWKVILENKAAKKLGPELLAILNQLCNFYSPTGIGLPAGLSLSQLILDLACDAFDQKLATLGSFAARYVDDIVVVGAKGVANELASLIEQELGDFGLEQHPDKTKRYDIGFGSATIGKQNIEFLGFSMSTCGAIDVGKKTAQKLALAGGTHQVQLASYFGLAQLGDRYRNALELQIGRCPGFPGRDPVGNNPFGCSMATSATLKPHPAIAPAGNPRVLIATVVNSSGGGRRGRGTGTSRSLRLMRNNLESQLLVWGGYTKLLLAARAWDSAQHPDLESIRAQILFGETPERVRQYSRALAYWGLLGELLWGKGIGLTTAEAESMIRFLWPVLMVAATVTEPAAVRVCRADPIEQLFAFYGGAGKKTCIDAIHSERQARKAGVLPTSLSMWGEASTQLARGA